MTKRELLVEVWQQPWGGSDKTVDVHLSWLRRKLGESARRAALAAHRARRRRAAERPRTALMRRSLFLTVAAATTMVLLAMLVPMAVLLRSYVLEDRLAQAALEVQATETIVSGGDTRPDHGLRRPVNADGADDDHRRLPRRRARSARRPTTPRPPASPRRASPAPRASTTSTAAR